ncbi:MAG: cytochrome c1 [Thioalkalispiraceae bacterium]|jgi:ubiquinol-cytochrome c reductase cytochrome c1 subunit
MKKIMISLLMMPLVAFAAGGGVHLDKADIDLDNKESLQRGAKLFVNYCLSCHSASYMRYNRMAKDLGLDDKQVENNMMFIADFSKLEEGEPGKVGNLMKVALRTEDAKQMFGTKVPDLTVVSRSRGADWLYTYLRTFYLDESRPFGVNNATFKDVGMPHVLWELEGLKKAIKETHKDHEGNEVSKIVDYEIVVPGKMKAAEYDNAIRDLVNFMVYMGEPAQLVRYKWGVIVLIFLFLLFIPAYALKKEYWKDVH